MAFKFTMKLTLRLACAIMIIVCNQIMHAMTSDARHDPFPFYTSLDPHTFLQTQEKLCLKGLPVEPDANECIQLSISPFRQTADNARNIDKQLVPIGDIDGRWAMVALLFGNLPQNQVLPPVLQAARACLFPTVPEGVEITNCLAVDPNQLFGFFTIPVTYRKKGCRFEFDAMICHDVGIRFQAGVADINMTHTQEFVNLTPCPLPPFNPLCNDPNNPNITANNINSCLMCKVQEIAKELCLNIANFHEVSAEDVRASIFWRHAFPINMTRIDRDWAPFLFIPFAVIEGSLAAGKPKDPSKMFGVSFGSDGHNAVGFTTGFNIDFTETIEIGAEAGFDHFFSRNFCKFHIPNSKLQSGIYPFAADVNIQPGNNWHFGAKLSAYHFLDRLSFYLEYLIVHHDHDRICLKQPDPAFKPEILERRSYWKNQMFNAAFNYDISPNISLGVLWQAPFKQQNSFVATTVLFSLNITY